jgi:hypothetical protein
MKNAYLLAFGVLMLVGTAANSAEQLKQSGQGQFGDPPTCNPWIDPNCTLPPMQLR